MEGFHFLILGESDCISPGPLMTVSNGGISDVEGFHFLILGESDCLSPVPLMTVSNGGISGM